MDWGAIIFDLVVTVFFYLLVPVIFCLLKKPMTKKQINKVIIINGAILWLIFRIISIEINGEPGTGAAVFLWSWVGQKIMEKVLLKAEDNKQDDENVKSDTNLSLSFENEKPKKEYGNWNISGDDIRLETVEANEVSNTNQRVEDASQKKVRVEEHPPKTRYYCSICGGLIDDNTRKCTECGKQHSKKLSKAGIALIIVSALLVIVCVAWGTSVVQSRNTTTTTTTIEPPNSPSFDEMSFSEWVVAREIAGIMSGDLENFDYLESYYFDCIVEAYEIAGEGSTSYEQAQDAVIDYLNDLDIEYGEKIIIYRLIYQYDNQYNSDILEYLNNREDISYDDEVYILQELGMTVDSDGNVSWD